ncbi:MAG: hypothetical protein ACT4PZ_24995 [Panacagrimonas sp.]
MNRPALCFVTLAAGIGGVIAPTARAAEQDNRGGSFGTSVSTNGVGVDYTYAFNRHFDVRAGYDFGSLSRELNEGNLDYNAELKFSAARLLLNYKPFGGSFRLSGGLYSSGPQLDLDTSKADNFELDDRQYNGDGELVGGIDFGGAAPYVGLGWGGATRSGFGVNFDLGVIFTGAPEVSLAMRSGFVCDAGANPNCNPATDGFPVNGDSPQAAEFNSSVEAERQELEDGVGSAKFWPVARLGLYYRF